MTETNDSEALDAPPAEPEESEQPPSKKVRLSFSVKQFRKSLQSQEKTPALQNFLQIIEEHPEQDCIGQYLKTGGTVLELLKTAEDDSTLSPLLLLEVVNKILLTISCKLKKFFNGGQDACRYLITNYSALFNKMLSLSSTTKERLITLKLLATVVTFSAILAKDVLLTINFNPSNLQVLTKGGEVRWAFVHFICAFLVGGYFPIVAVLLEKKGLLTSVINGLQYDKVDIVVTLMTMMEQNILSNPSVSKTVKMKTFSTPVVQSIVNLYNWKGPAGIQDSKAKPTTAVQVNEIDKSKVNEAVHNFLLILCTSHKFGVIFKDPLFGLGTKQQNNLIVTVLDKLERPWEHSYAEDLILRICRACPDLTKSVWSNLIPFLEPRYTAKWLKALKFAEKLLDGIDELAMNNLTEQQMGRIIINLIAPPAVFKTLLVDATFQELAVKHHVFCYLLKTLEALEKQMNLMNQKNINSALTHHIYQYFPNAIKIQLDCDLHDENISAEEDLSVALDLLGKYRILAPDLLDGLNVDINRLMERSSVDLKIKIANLFLDLEPALFQPKQELFARVLEIGFEYYYSAKTPLVLRFLRKLLQNTALFDDNLSEIDFWVDGVLNLKHYNNDAAILLLDLIRSASEKIIEYNQNIFKLANSNFSIIFLALLDKEHIPEGANNYCNFVTLNLFHIQTNLPQFYNLISKLQFFSEDFAKYFENWAQGQSCSLPKPKGKLLAQLSKFSVEFFEGNVPDLKWDLYLNAKLNYLRATIFYFTNLVSNNEMTASLATNCTKLSDILLTADESAIKSVVGNPGIIENFSIYYTEKAHNFVANFCTHSIKTLPVESAEPYFAQYRTRIVSSILKMFKKPEKYSDQIFAEEVLATIGLTYEDCQRIIKKFLVNKNTVFCREISYCLSRIAFLAKNNYSFEPLPDDDVEILAEAFVCLIKNQPLQAPCFSVALLAYLQVFPHTIDSIPGELFDSLVSIEEFHKDNALLCAFLLQKKASFLENNVVANLDAICAKRSLFLSLVNILIAQHDDVLQEIFAKTEHYITKALEKPHKAGKNFESCYHSIGILIEKFMNCDKYGAKVVKFEAVEVFHVHFLKVIFQKVATSNPKAASNAVLTFFHLLMNLFKVATPQNSREVCEIVLQFFESIDTTTDLTHLSNNETLKKFCKTCLGSAIGGDALLLKIFRKVVELCVKEEEGYVISQMIMGHSQFLDMVRGGAKAEIWDLWLVLCRKFPQCMERFQVPILLTSYEATNRDSQVLELLKMYESKSDQTKFFDFKPFIWGPAAASLYSAQSNLQKVLWRQPKMADVLNNLYPDIIVKTIANPTAPDSYDLNYFLPLFSHLLSPENLVHPYRFTKSGALALTLVGLRGSQSQRLATANVIQRFYFHLDAKQTGKDNKLWLRFIEAICKGIVGFEDFQINNFVGVFLARMALVLAQPRDVMYMPLSQYLTAKDTLDFTTIPELYTLLHSPHVDSRKHQLFILEIINDGLRTDTDFTTFLKSMGFKLISELCSSHVCDSATRSAILDVFKKCCERSLGTKILCGNLSFLTQLFGLLTANPNDLVIVRKALEVLEVIINMDGDQSRNFIVYLNLMVICEDAQKWKNVVDSKSVDTFFGILSVIVKRQPNLFTQENLDVILSIFDDSYCKYLISYGTKYVRDCDIDSGATNRNLKLFIYNKLTS